MIKTFNINEINKNDYNFIVSNLILSQTEKFTYDDIINKLRDMFHEINIELESTVKKCLIRLRDDNFLSVLGSIYEVKEIDIRNL